MLRFITESRKNIIELDVFNQREQALRAALADYIDHKYDNSRMSDDDKRNGALLRLYFVKPKIEQVREWLDDAFGGGVTFALNGRGEHTNQLNISLSDVQFDIKLDELKALIACEGSELYSPK